MIIGPGITFGSGIIFDPPKTYIETLIVAGGGKSGNRQGTSGWYGTAGAGGVVYGNADSRLLLPIGVSKLVTVGAQVGTGISNSNAGGVIGLGIQGNNSSIGDIVAYGGAAGTSAGGVLSNGNSGGSGGGATAAGPYYTRTGGASTQVSYPSYELTGYGNAGGSTDGSIGNYAGAGGGAGGPGGLPKTTAQEIDGLGGPGLTVSITGSPVEYARGGGFHDSQTLNLNPTRGGGGGCQNESSGRYAPGIAGIVILAYLIDQFNPLNIGAGLTYTLDTASRPGYRIYSFTAGSGYINAT